MGNVYSFQNVNANIAGAGGLLDLASGAAAAEEGVEVDQNNDKNVMQIGADGRGQHSLVADDSGTVTVRLLKTSPINQGLMNMYNLQSASSALWGQNIITIVDSARGDTIVCEACAFKKPSKIVFAKEAGLNEWVFDVIKITRILGT